VRPGNLYVSICTGYHHLFVHFVTHSVLLLLLSQDALECPVDHYKVKQSEFDKQCDKIGLPCPEGYSCYCKPCIKAFEVDVMQVNSEHNSTGGCGKMALCGSARQNQEAKFLIIDNRERDDAVVETKLHAGQETSNLPVTRSADSSYAYEFTFADNTVGVSILEVFVNGQQIPESPFRVEVTPRDCEEEYPGQGKQPVSFITIG
jgi:hypothetical protein